ncbi:MAG: hypothetical protein ACKN9T_11105 [Candidatus Methylumidiphilus sp.]
MALNFNFSRAGTSHYAEAIGGGTPKFLIGKETIYERVNHGLFNLTTPSGLLYDANAYAPTYGFWAYFIAPTAKAESNNSFICLNTYDRARFTFGFMQYAAHVANGDFVRYFRQLLQLPNAADYFPKLALSGNQICYRDASGTLTPLENSSSTADLLDYLNPTLSAIESQELITAARMIHWTTHDAKHRELQVATAIEFFKENMQDYAKQYNLDGYPAKVCQVVCDIRHQGRAKSSHIIRALNTGGNFNLAYDKLTALGLPLYKPRINTIRSEINKLLTAGLFGKTYDQSTNSFV